MAAKGLSRCVYDTRSPSLTTTEDIVCVPMYVTEMTKEESVVHLDASSSKKFSRHLIFKISSAGQQHSAAFVNNLAVGRYVRQLMVRLN